MDMSSAGFITIVFGIATLLTIIIIGGGVMMAMNPKYKNRTR